MLTVHPQYIKDTNGNSSLVVLPIHEFESIMEELEELEDIRLYDEAKKEDTGQRILFTDYVNSRKMRHG
jgi:PHD/YefM family antitoxin component YafN of YafNO toxin-antitoxin module